MKLAAFPKCYMDELCVHRTMSVFDWIALAEKELKPLGVTGLEMYMGFLTAYEPGYLVEVRAAIEQVGFVMPMFCAFFDFTLLDVAYCKVEVEKER